MCFPPFCTKAISRIFFFLKVVAIATTFIEDMELCLDAATSLVFGDGTVHPCLYLGNQSSGLGLHGTCHLVIEALAKYIFFKY